MDVVIGTQPGDVDRSQQARCMSCNRPRPPARRAPGLDAVVPGAWAAWLCEDCEARPGRAWAFVDVVRTLDPAAVLLTTSAYADRVVQAPLVVPDPGWSAPPASDLPRRPGTGRLLPTKPAD
jgi:hypothetical protein